MLQLWLTRRALRVLFLGSMRQLLLLAAVSLSTMAIASLAGCDSRDTQSGNSFRPSLSAPLESRTPAPAAAPKSDKPRVVSWPDLERYYPEDAVRDHTNGIVRITVTLDKTGSATDTHILSETPPNLGFGAAASTVAHQISYSNPTGHEASVTFNIKFRSPHLSRLQRKLERLR
ncbi:MAG: TonB family protein [Steroidobacteraceae bacterium]